MGAERRTEVAILRTDVGSEIEEKWGRKVIAFTSEHNIAHIPSNAEHIRKGLNSSRPHNPPKRLPKHPLQ